MAVRVRVKLELAKQASQEWVVKPTKNVVVKNVRFAVSRTQVSCSSFFSIIHKSLSLRFFIFIAKTKWSFFL